MRDPVEFYEGRIHVSDAVILGVVVVARSSQVRGIRGQEFLLGEARPADARVSVIAVTCVLWAIHVGQEATCDVAPQEVAQQPAQLPGGSTWGASGFFLVGGRLFTSSGHVEDVSAFHAWQFAGMLRDPAHGQASCENGV